MWTDEQFKQYRKESTALETSVENILGDESLRSCVRSVCSNLRINSYRFRVVFADATDFKIEEEHNISFQISRNDNILTISVCEGWNNIYTKCISLRKWSSSSTAPSTSSATPATRKNGLTRPTRSSGASKTRANGITGGASPRRPAVT